MHQTKLAVGASQSPSPNHIRNLSTNPHSTYTALIQRGLSAGLTAREIACALSETTGAISSEILDELKISLTR